VLSGLGFLLATCTQCGDERDMDKHNVFGADGELKLTEGFEEYH
jgi:hypothetical protein